MAQEYTRFKDETHVEIEGKKYRIVETFYGNGITSIICEGWEERHPDRLWEERHSFPDAVSTTGRIVPRVKNFTDVTFDDMKAAGMMDNVLMAKDRAISDARTDRP